MEIIRRKKLLGIRVDIISSWAECLKIVEEFLSTSSPHLVITLGTEMLMLARKRPALAQVINNADLVIPDSAGIVWGVKLLLGEKIVRLPGINLAEKLVALSGERGFSIFLLGGKPNVAENAKRRLLTIYPKACIIGTHHGYFKNNEEEVIRLISNKKSDVLLLALGVPFQEEWGWANLEKLGAKLVIGIGGSLDVFSGEKRRAPVWLQNMGLEWFYRLLKEPWRWKRMLVLPVFAGLVLREKFLGR